MTKLGAFIESIAEDFKAKAALTAAGLMVVLAIAQPVDAQQTFSNHERAVADRYEANAINERVTDQLGDMKTFSDALCHSFSFGSPDIDSRQKARNIMLAYEFSIRQQVNPEVADFDRYFLTIDQSTARTEGLDELVQAINEKKQALLDGTAVLKEIVEAYAQGREDDALTSTEILEHLSEQIEDQLYNDVSYEGESAAPAQRIDVVLDRSRIDVVLERQKIDVVIERTKTDVVLERPRIYFTLDRGAPPEGFTF